MDSTAIYQYTTVCCFYTKSESSILDSLLHKGACRNHLGTFYSIQIVSGLKILKDHCLKFHYTPTCITAKYQSNMFKLPFP